MVGFLTMFEELFLLMILTIWFLNRRGETNSPKANILIFIIAILIILMMRLILGVL